MKKLTALVLFVVIISLLSGCGLSMQLSSDYDKAEVESAAKEIVLLADDGDYAAVIDRLSPGVSQALTAESLKESWEPVLEKIGAHGEYKSVVVIGQADKSTGEEYAVAVIVSSHENGTSQFTLSFNQQLDLVGLYLK
ncbi:MAG: DUF3887 domain-containing protein [Christensenellales bacterium]|jgi:uncharacterized lipoprotein